MTANFGRPKHFFSLRKELTMSKEKDFDLLGRLVSFLTSIPQYWGVLVDFAEKLNSQQGEIWAREFAKFLRKEATWQEADLFIPEGWKVESHKQDAFQADSSKITLYLSEGQKGSYVQGFKLQKELEDQPVLNANTLDYLLARPDLIPEEWKGKVIFFWGTIYGGPDGRLYVRYLYWDDGRWDWSYVWLDCSFFCSFPAACSQV